MYLLLINKVFKLENKKRNEDKYRIIDSFSFISS